MRTRNLPAVCGALFFTVKTNSGLGPIKDEKKERSSPLVHVRRHLQSSALHQAVPKRLLGAFCGSKSGDRAAWDGRGGREPLLRLHVGTWDTRLGTGTSRQEGSRSLPLPSIPFFPPVKDGPDASTVRAVPVHVEPGG